MTDAAIKSGRNTIPAENAAELDRLGEDIHELILAGKKVPLEMRQRLYVLEGASEQEAEMLASVPENAECNDTHAR